LVSRLDEDLSRLLKEYELTVDNDRQRKKGKRDAR